MARIPVIDISPFLSTSAKSNEKKAQVAKAWNDAFSDSGFAYITGHGISEDIIANLYEDALSFFKLTSDEKLKYFKGQGGHFASVSGYHPLASESVGKTMIFNENDKDSKYFKSPPDLAESLKVVEEHGGFSFSPSKCPSDMQTSMQKYWSCMHQLLNTIMEISGVALGLEADYFQPFYKNPYECLKLTFYPPQNENKPLPGQLRYGPHTDFIGYTILWQDDAPGGLEVSGKEEGSWIPVEPKKGTFVINAGDAIQQWTNDHWKANLHRVVNPPEDQSDRHRLAFLFFTGTNLDTIIKPLSVCCTDDNPPKYLPISTGDLLQRKLEIIPAAYK